MGTKDTEADANQHTNRYLHKKTTSWMTSLSSANIQRTPTSSISGTRHQKTEYEKRLTHQLRRKSLNENKEVLARRSQLWIDIPVCTAVRHIDASHEVGDWK
jgi:hypothetical protein